MASTETSLLKSTFEYDLPPERIAQTPLASRDTSKLMVVDRRSGQIQHRVFRQIEEFLRSGDVLVLNATRVFPARLRGHKRSGGKAELLLLRQEEGLSWQALVRGASAPDVEIVFAEGMVARLNEELAEGEWRVTFSQGAVRDFLERYGEMPLPPYIKRSERDEKDAATYQTVFAREEGSIAAPTAGFHFTDQLLSQLKTKGVQVAEVVLHVGWGTFRPVRSEIIQEHRMLPERYELSASTAERLNAARREGRRIIAVGTTSVRTLESTYDSLTKTFRAQRGEANLFIYPGYPFHALDALITNFHLPHSTPLLLACAFYSTEPAFTLRTAYEEAIREQYRFYSYGDAMFIQ